MLLLKSLCILSVIRITYEEFTDAGKPCPKYEMGVCKYEEQCPSSDWHGFCGADENGTVLLCCTARDTKKVLNYYTAREFPDRTQCGLPSMVKKVFNGDNTQIGEYPWMAALLYVATENQTYGGVRCGGTLITEKFVLTAAHCVSDQTPESIRVLLGAWNITSDLDYYNGGKCDMCTAKNKSADRVINAKIDKIISHEFYKTSRNDIALLRLDTPVNFTGYVRPVCLPSEDFPDLKNEDSLWIAGWGKTETNRPSVVLLKAQLNFLAEDKCLDRIQRTQKIHSTEFCAYNLDKDACRGDSGGPLIKGYTDKHANWFQLGIVASGFDCSIGATATIYTRVSSFIRWIADHTTPTAERNSRCKTPDNKNGKCVLVSECPVLEQQYLQPEDSSEVVRRSLCGRSREDRSDLVCCKGSAIKRGNAKEGSPCKTPKPERIDGQCVRITNCPALKNASNTAHEHMLKSQCGFDDELFVCCKMQDIVMASEPKKLEEFPSANIPNRTICGQVRNDNTKGEYPWLAALMSPWELGYYLYCQGSLINKRFVLTTAQCLSFGHITSYRVFLGTGLIDDRSDCHAKADCPPHMQNLTVEEAIRHPFFHYLYSLNNIALVRLTSDVKFDDYVSPICLPPLNLQPLRTDSRSEVIVAGWGTPDRGGYGVHTLVNAKAGLLDGPICVTIYTEPSWTKVHKQEFCIPSNYSLPFCITGSGGPIMKVHKDQRGQNFFLVGIHSGVWNCKQHGYDWHTSNVRISAYTSWIVQTIAKTT